MALLSLLLVVLVMQNKKAERSKKSAFSLLREYSSVQNFQNAAEAEGNATGQVFKFDFQYVNDKNNLGLHPKIVKQCVVPVACCFGHAK